MALFRLRAIVVPAAFGLLLAVPRLPAQPPATEAPRAPTSAWADASLAQATLDTVAARIAQLELRRLELVATSRPREHPDVQATRRRLSVLRQLLDSLPDPQAARAQVDRALLAALEARLATVAVERRLRAVELPAKHPDLWRLAEEEALLTARRTELRAALARAAATSPQR